MNTAFHKPSHWPGLRAQQGTALLVVMILMMLAVLTALGTSRMQWLAERVVGSESDMQRAFVAAEALLADAELDIHGFRADGTTPCSTEKLRFGCRDNLAGRPYFPLERQDFLEVVRIVSASGKPCMDGICFPASSAEWTPTYLKDNQTTLTQSGVAATYGQFTGASAQAAGNALLATNPPRAWYWVEVFVYNKSGEASAPIYGMPSPSESSPIVFRITALAQGLRPGTRVWLRKLLVLDDTGVGTS